MTNDELAAVLAKLDIRNEFPSVLAIWPRWADGGVEVCLGATAFWRTVKCLGVAVTSEEPPDRLTPTGTGSLGMVSSLSRAPRSPCSRRERSRRATRCGSPEADERDAWGREGDREGTDEVPERRRSDFRSRVARRGLPAHGAVDVHVLDRPAPLLQAPHHAGVPGLGGRRARAPSPVPGDAPGIMGRVQTGRVDVPALRSRKVRRILRLEAQAGRMEARQAKARARAELLRRRSDALRTEARAIEGSLTGSQFGELRRVRSGEG
jgi:hypothetical protein